MRKTPPKNNGSLPLWPPVSDWKPPILSELPSWEGQPRVSIDTEFVDDNLRKLGLGSRRGVKAAGYSFAFEDGRKYYVPLRHPEGNVDLHNGAGYFRDQAAVYEGELVGANIPTEIDLLHYEPTGAITFPKVRRISDVLLAAPLIYELHAEGYSLEAESHRRLGHESGKDETLIKEAAACYGADTSKKGWKRITGKLPAKYVGPYGEHDALLPLRVLTKQKEIMEKLGILGCWDLESALLPCLLVMTQRGVRIDFAKLDFIDKKSRAAEKDLLDQVYHLTQIRIRPGDTMKIGAWKPAFEAVGLTIPKAWDEKKREWKDSLNKECLSQIPHPLAALVLKARKAAKRYSTFVKSIQEHQVNGRIHTRFNQVVGSNDRNEKTGAAFGRLSSRHPNAQQQPNDKEWRSIYLPEEGTKWGCLDLSQQEPRWTTHFASSIFIQPDSDESRFMRMHGRLHGAKEAAQAYWDNPKIDNHQFMSDITGVKRSYAKAIFLGLCYGEGGAKMCRGLGLPTRWAVRKKGGYNDVEYFTSKADAYRFRQEYKGEAYMHEVAGKEGQDILDKFNERAPYIRQLARYAEYRAKTTGKVTLFGGRIINFPLEKDGTYGWAYKALNRVIQGSGGMQVKKSIIDIFREMPKTFLQLQVHDEVDGSFGSIREMKQVAQLLADAAGQCNVPFRVDIETGDNWGEMSQVCGVGSCEFFVNKELEINGVKEAYACEHHAHAMAA